MTIEEATRMANEGGEFANPLVHILLDAAGVPRSAPVKMDEYTSIGNDDLMFQVELDLRQRMLLFIEVNKDRIADYPKLRSKSPASAHS